MNIDAATAALDGMLAERQRRFLAGIACDMRGSDQGGERR